MKTLPQRGTYAVNSKRQLDPRYQVVIPPLRHWWESFNVRWSRCDRCPLSSHRNRVVQFRGIIPARFCFVGEAPGESENELGRPFVGRAGILLDQMLEKIGLEDGDFCIINTTGCLPWSVELNSFRTPEKSEIQACDPRYQDLVDHIEPVLIVLMGLTAQKNPPYLPVKTKATVAVAHPSAIVRGGEKPSDVDEFVSAVRQAISNLQ